MGEMSSAIRASIILFLFLVIGSNATYALRGKFNTTLKNQEIEKQLRILNKPYVTSFKTESGDRFDCVEIHKQPAFDHPLLKDHVLQREPSPALRGSRINTSETAKVKSIKGCPEGTVPIKRTRKRDLLRARMNTPVYDIKSTDLGPGSEYSILTLHDQSYYGAEALMDVYNVANINVDQVSTGQIILSNGAGGPRDMLNTIQFGWGVDYGLNDDYKARLFVFWTSDGYNNNGCANTLCPGWVQTSKNFSPGMDLPIGKSTVKLALHRDPDTLDWWIAIVVNDINEMMGYFPQKLFNSLEDADKIEFGGIVYSPSNETTMPPMGSGVRPGTEGDVCEFKQVAYMDVYGEFILPAYTTGTYTSNPNLYGVAKENRGGADGYIVKFGGPGGPK